MADENRFDDSPSGWAKRWAAEFASARKVLDPWREKSRKIVDRYRAKREGLADSGQRWNVFTSGVQTQLAMLYGQKPRVSVARRHGDSADDVARVAGEMLERLLNTDIDCDGDGYTEAIGLALQDRFLSGLSNVRLRYDVGETETESVEAMVGPDGAVLAEGYEVERRPDEDIEVLYCHPEDQLWSPARLWTEVRWWAFRSDMTREALVERFGEEIGKAVPLNSRKRGEEKRSEDPWDRAAVWEVWSKEHEQVFWVVEGYPDCLDQKEDPLGLEGFFPFPRPMMANLTTAEFLPTPDFDLTKDLYEELDILCARIELLEQAIRVAGVYDKASPEIKRLLGDARNNGNVMIPVDSWGAFAERGGLKGVVDWLPIEQVVNALQLLSMRRQELLDAIYQLTGMSDIMRGQAAVAGASATEQAIKSRFASVRMQALQDEFARFCSDILKLKGEIITRHFSPETIVERSNVLQTPDAQLAQQAVALLQSGEVSAYRIEVKPESIAMQDFAALKSERMEVLGGLSQFLTAAGPIMAQMPSATPLLMELLQWVLAGVKGSSEIEGVMDRAIAGAQQAAAQPKPAAPDPKLQATLLKGQLDQQKEQAKLQGELVKLQAEVAADEQREANQARWNIRETAAKARISAAMKPQEPGKPFGGGQ